MAKGEKVRSSPPTGQVFFPLASNAHSLLTGSGVESVRARLKFSALLYERVLIEAGQISIQAGPNAAMTWHHPFAPAEVLEWQTPVERSRSQGRRFQMSIAPEATYGVPATGPMHPVADSAASISWAATFHPFGRELPQAQNWFGFGAPGEFAPPFQQMLEEMKRRDSKNPALDRLVPERFVRSQILDDVAKDLVTGASGGWDVSIDAFHARVVNARWAPDSNLRLKSFALPILLPAVRNLSWDAIADFRRSKALQQLRGVLREVEMDAYQLALNEGDLERAVHVTFAKKVAAATSAIDRALPTTLMSLAGLAVSVATGYATIGLGLFGPAAALGPSAALAAWDVTTRIKANRHRAWIGMYESLSG